MADRPGASLSDCRRPHRWPQRRTSRLPL